jgi:hypothetical protein
MFGTRAGLMTGRSSPRRLAKFLPEIVIRMKPGAACGVSDGHRPKDTRTMALTDSSASVSQQMTESNGGKGFPPLALFPSGGICLSDPPIPPGEPKELPDPDAPAPIEEPPSPIPIPPDPPPPPLVAVYPALRQLRRAAGIGAL